MTDASEERVTRRPSLGAKARRRRTSPRVKAFVTTRLAWLANGVGDVGR